MRDLTLRPTLLAAILAALPLYAYSQQPAPLAPAAADVPSSPLADAAARGDFAAVRKLLDSGHADANALDRDGTPALHWAVRAGDRDTVAQLLAAGAKVDAPSRLGVRPLEIAIEESDATLVRALLAAGADVARQSRAGEPPLMIAARVGDPAVAAALLDRGAAVDAHERDFGQTALMAAAREGHVAVAQLLLDRGADPNAQTAAAEPPRFVPPSESPPGLSKGIGIVRAGWPEDRGKRFPAAGSKTPLLYAARAGNVEVAKLLLAHQADLELADGNGVTPLIEAIVNASVRGSVRDGHSGHLAVAHLLLDAGARVNAVDWYGETPLWAAVDLRNLELGPGNDGHNGLREDAYALAKRLLEAGADPNVRTKEFPHERRYVVGPIGSVAWVDLTGQTPFLRAAAAGDLTAMRLLLEHGADPNIATYGGTTPLMVAAGVNWAVDETYDEGPQALLEAVKLAHSLGNDVNAVNSMGIGAIHGAANRGANDVIEYLAANGARLDVADKQGRTPLDWAKGVFLATHPPEPKPDTIALLERLQKK
ncbi:MAG TPA: ankyrin repeat domain-containing protein [Gammaproteobacteria bacterium]|nr:ankyrin repeat domain-containing protein [Gammaproteobacteria bacterium]